MRFTTLVPAYKPKYLVELLTALRHQTVKPARVIFSDDSPDQAFVKALSSEPLKSLVADLVIEVLPGLRQGAYTNFRRLVQLYGGQTELFHLLLDDDIPYPSFYERHLQAHQKGFVPCVVSRRWTALESGQPLRDLPVPPAVASHEQRLLALDAPTLFTHTAGHSSNWLGEFSNVTFRAEMAADVDEPSLDGISFTGLEDLGAFLKVSLHGPIGYINEHLGYFRTSAEQHSADVMGRPLKLAHLAYLALVIAGRRLSQLAPELAAATVAGLCPLIVQRYGQQPDMAWTQDILPRLATAAPGAEAETEFLRLWHAYCGPLVPLPPPAPEITVLLPMYKGEAYLPATLDALLAQSFRRFELLCIDDCSPDGSLAIAEDYARRDARVRVLRMRENQGCVPKVLNQVLEQMRGRYCVYSSQDDRFSPDWLEQMHSRALQTDADAVIPDLVFWHEQEPERNRSLIGLRGDRSVELSGREAVAHSLDWTIPANALWKAELVKRLRYEEFASNADEFSGRVFFLHCNKVVFSEGQFLYRQDNPGAITKQLGPRSFDLAYTFLRLFLFLRENGFAPALYAREALKALNTLKQMQQWLAGAREQLSAAELADAQSRSQRYEQLLREHGIFEAFDTTPTETAA